MENKGQPDTESDQHVLIGKIFSFDFIFKLVLDYLMMFDHYF